MKNCGFSAEKAMRIEARYNELYKTSIEWTQSKLDEASKTGYVVGAFGLRVRTPLLQQVVRNTSKTPYEAQAEGRTAGNALGQSWCLLNSRAWVETMQQIRPSKFATLIRPCSQIHDAGYAIIKDDPEVVLYLNKILVKAVNWNDHPDIYHPMVGLGGELSIFHPTWAEELTLPNELSEEVLLDLSCKHLVKLQGTK